MNTIDMSEILNLYKKCNVSVNGSGAIRNTLNYGTLNNNLNVGNAYWNVTKTDSILANNTYFEKGRLGEH